MCTLFNVARLYLWNRTKERADNLKRELEKMRPLFCNKVVEILVCDTVTSGTRMADVIVSATFAKAPVVMFDSVKKNVHINGRIWNINDAG